jgi:hypothetical protein
MILGIELIAIGCWDQEILKNNEELDIPISKESLELKVMTFYNIDNVRHDSDNTCFVSSGGEDFLINDSAEAVNLKIQERLTFKFN